ncbi:serine protease [Bacteriovorax sp. Seq25_V]|uniref:trypsin-like serine peptidase n=1 Tax=Bacteriovorax sp. Seq25_V TaxID=1201288 RepID=UPI00038A4466|nr:serine protease [Bacteriovorax sp. Seq25_V]EQC45296.1 trypsin [Bacteriovorax sp. Seq25_V]
MKLKLLILLSLTLSTFAMNKGVYGTDDRVEASLYHNPIIKEQSKAVAAMIYSSHIKEIDENTHELMWGKYGMLDNFCKEVPFQGQPTSSNCTAFLISPTKVMTAGHCMRSTYNCNDTKFAFNYNIENVTGPHAPYDRFHINGVKLYSCKNIDITINDKNSLLDYAIVELDRPVEGVTPLSLRKQGAAELGDGVYMIGTPGGIPLKITDNATVFDSTSEVFFRTDLDAFHRNSGSPVLNEKTHEVEGILVRGRPDYQKQGTCKAIKKCDSKDCPEGEEVTKINATKVFDFIN